MPELKPTNKITLDILLQTNEEYPGSAFMTFDFDFKAIFGKTGRIPVKLTVDGHTYRSTIAVYAGVHMMVFNRQMRLDTGYKAGDTIRITLEHDLEKRSVEIPEDVKEALQNAGVWEAFTRYSYSHQKENVAWISDAKKPETRLRRIAKLITTLE